MSFNFQNKYYHGRQKTEAYSTTTQNSHLETEAKYKSEEYKAPYLHYIDTVSVRVEIEIDFRLTDI